MASHGSGRADVVVVGAGVIGLSIAWRLARAGLGVVVVDPAPGSGASKVAAGMLAPATEAAYGEEALLELNLESARRWDGFAKALEADAAMRVGLVRAGTLMVAVDASDRAELEELAAFQRRLGLHASWCAPSRARELEPLLAPGIAGAVFAEDDHQVHNRRLLAALSTAAGRGGARHVASACTGIEVTAGAVTAVHVGDRRIAAPVVVLSAGHASAAIPGLPPGAVPGLRPVKGQILRLYAPVAALRASRTVRARVAGHSVYVVPRDDGRVVVGATVEEQGRDTAVTAGAVYGLLRDATRVLPVLGEYELSEINAGLRPASDDNAPLIGEGATSGLVLATGHFRNGILLAPATAAAVTELVRAGEVPAFARPFSPARPGAIRTAAPA